MWGLSFTFKGGGGGKLVGKYNWVMHIVTTAHIFTFRGVGDIECSQWLTKALKRASVAFKWASGYTPSQKGI